MQGTQDLTSPVGQARRKPSALSFLHFCRFLLSTAFRKSAFSVRSSGSVARRQRGAAMSEMLVVIPALLLLGLGTMQAALMYNARNTVDYATFEAARKGAVSNAQTANMRQELGVRIAPLFGGDGTPAKAADAISKGMLEASDPAFTRIRILNPTAAAFNDFGVENDQGIIEIPNTHLRHRSRQIEPASLVNIQDANLLKIEVTYGYRLKVPLVSRVIPAVMKLADPENADFYAQGRIPITSVATVRMQSPAWVDAAAVPGGAGVTDSGAMPGSPPGFSTTTEKVQADGSSTRTTTTIDRDGTTTITEETTRPDGTVHTVVRTTTPDGTTTETQDQTDHGSDGDGTEGSEDTGEEETECETEWTDEEYQFVESDGIWESIKNLPKNLTAAVNVIKSFFEGIIEGVGDQVKDLVEVLLDPGILLDIAKAAIEDPIGFMKSLIEGLVDDVKTVMQCGPADIGRIIGQNVQPAVFLKAVAVLAKSARLAKYADDLDPGSNKKDGDNENNDKPDDSTSCRLVSSFVEGTRIRTPDGSALIEELQVGDRVASRDEHTFESAPQGITQTFRRLAPFYHRLTTDAGEVDVTAEHPVWVQGKGWTPVDEVASQDLIATADGDALVLVNRRIDEPVQVYNFSVASTPNYFAGDGWLWVHNQSCSNTAKDLEEIRKLLDDYPNGDNYVVYHSNGLPVIRRKDGSVGDRLEWHNGAVQVYRPHVDIPAKVTPLPPVKHSDMGTGANATRVEIDGNRSTNGPRETVDFDVEMNNLNARRADVVARRDEAITMPDGPERDALLNNAHAELREVSEQMGELAAGGYIAKTYPGATRLESRLPGNGRQGEFDQIYQDGDRVIIVEAKGGSADWGTRKQGVVDGQSAQQGSREYMDSIIDNYQKALDSGGLNPSDARALQETVDVLREGVMSGNIEFIGIKQKAGAGGISDSMNVFKFDVQG